MKMNDPLTIGKLAIASGVSVETIRFYERKAILKQPLNKIGAFRSYPKEYISRIKFIKRAQELGFTLNETKDLLNLKIKNQSRCGDVLEKTEEKIREIDAKIADLKKMRKSLKGLANCCKDENQPLSECPILECFFKEKERK